MAKSIAELKLRERPRPDWLLPGLLKRGNTAFIIGQPKRAVKSWLMLALAWDLSEGHPAWAIKRRDGEYQFVPPRPMRTVYFAQEDTEDDVHDRVMAHFNTGRAENDKLWIVPKNLRITLDTDSGRAEMQRELDSVRESAGPIDLVMFDPLRRMHHGDENDSGVFAVMWGVLDRIHRRYGCATLISHHTVKPPSGEGRVYFDASDPYTARGSGDIYGGGDAFMTIVPKKLNNEPPWRKVAMHFESKRGRPLAPAMLKVHLDTGGVEYMGEAWQRQAGEEEDETKL